MRTPPRLAAALAAVALLAACSKAAPPRVRPPPSVTVARVQARDVPVEILAPVDLRPLAQAEISAKTAGYLDAVLVDRGDRVRRGQTVALVRPSDLPDQLAAARGALAQAQASAVLAKANKERADRLAPSGVVSQQELQSATAAAAAADASLGAAQANVQALAVRLGEMRIESPLDGVVSQRRLDPGPLVGPNSGSGSILTVERDDVLRVFVPVNERDVAGVRVGQDARVELDAFPGRSYPGKVVRISPAFDALTRTIDAEVHVRNPGELRSGMYGRAAIVTAVHRDALVISAASAQVSSDRYVVFVVDGDTVRRRQVEVGVDGGTWLEVTRGLKRGDEVVTAGMDVLSDGAKVKVYRSVDPYTGAAVTESSAPAPAR